MAKSDFRVRKCCIYTYFFLSVSWLNRFGSIRFNRFLTLETETELNRNFFVIFNRLIRFFFSVQFFWLIFFRFSRFISFFAHP